MGINLNKEMVTKGELMKYVTDLEVYQRYIDEEIIPNKPILSPLRNENKPSFGLFRGQSGEICFKDFLLGSGDCIKFVQMKFNLTFFEALSKIAIDFGMEDDFIVKKMDKTTSNDIKTMNRDEFLTKATTFELKKTRRKWLIHDVLFWQQFGISITTLEKFWVEPISYFHINEKIIKADKYAYCFIEFKDGKETYKIYQPYNQMYKWLNSHNNTIWQGWSQLPEKGENLIITKSLKDVMTLYSFGITAIAPNSEHLFISEKQFEKLKARFKNIYVFYDNDLTGISNMNKIRKKFNVKCLWIPKKYGVKDISDFYQRYGQEETLKLINSIYVNRN